MRRIHMGAKMQTSADAGYIGMSALVHGFELFERKPRVAGPGGKRRRNGQGNIVDGHGITPLVEQYGVGQLAVRYGSKLPDSKT